MKKVYLVFAIYENLETNESYTRVVHVCNDKDLAIQYANEYINDDIRDISKDHTDFIVASEDGNGCVIKYFSERDLLSEEPATYVTSFIDGDFSKGISEEFSIWIEAHEVKED